MDFFSFQPVSGNPFARLGKAESVSYDPHAPLDEVADASRQVGLKYLDAVGTQRPLMDMMREFVELQQAESYAERHLVKAHGSGLVAAKSDEPKARTAPIIQAMGMGGAFIPKPGIPFNALRQLSTRIEIIQAIHRTRKRQVMAFAQPSTKLDEIGWKLVHSDGNRKLDPSDQVAEAEYFTWLSQVLQAGGLELDPRKRRQLCHQDFRQFLGMLVDDSLTLDHVPVETVAARAGGARGLDSWYVRDGATFFLADTYLDGEADDRFMVQSMLDGAGSIEPFNYDEVALFQRNLTPELEQCGYARSELESSLETISNFIQAIAHTREGIDNNAIPKGLLILSGAYNPQQQAAFQQAWQARQRGAQNSFTLPVMMSRGQQGAAQYISTGAEFSEMHFARWIALQSSVATAIYGMDPAEIGMEAFSVQTSNLSGDDTAARLAASRDKGLRPLLTDIEGFISPFIVGRFWDKARVEFCGLDISSADQRRQERAAVMTINEKREALGMPPYPIAWIGELPADAGLMAQEKQRLDTVMTFNEGRKVYGGLDPHPDPVLGNTPLNPSMGVSYQTALAGFDAFTNGQAPRDEDPNAEDDVAPETEEAGPDAGNDAPTGEGAAPATGDRRDTVAARLEGMRPSDARD